MDPIITVRGLDKVYVDGHHALKSVDLEIHRGEIFALLGPNGAGKTTLIGIICGLVRPSAGSVIVQNHHIERDYRAARASIGLVPQELATDMFETVRATLNFSRGLFGLPPDPATVERVLKDLSLWDKRDSVVMTLSGGMKRRVLIAKALVHDPKVLFLDEPTAGVDVELRRDMWSLVRGLRDQGVTVILTTHYIEEAEEMADRIGVIDHGQVILVEEKHALMRKLGRTEVTITLQHEIRELPAPVKDWPVTIAEDGTSLSFVQDGEPGKDGQDATALIKHLAVAGIDFKGIDMHRSSLEDIFVDLVGRRQ